MKPISLRLKGFIGIYKGMGKEEITLDLSDLSGLVAFDAKNGSGKTTILDSLHPYRRLASRSGSYQHHVMLRDSEKEYIFELNGSTYKTLVKIDSHSGRQEGFIWKNGEPQVNGKVSEYDKYIENLIGSETLFFNSVFCAQGSQKLSDLTTGKLKELFSEFLRLNRFVAWEETAKQAANKLQAKLEQATRDILDKQLRINNFGNINTDIATISGQRADKGLAVQEANESLARLQAEHKTLVQKVAESAANKKQKAALELDIVNLEQKIQKGENRLATIKSDMQNKISDVKNKIHDNEAVMAGTEDVESFKAELAGKNKQLSSLEEDKLEIESDREIIRKNLDSTNDQLTELKSQQTKTESEITRLEKLIDDQWAKIRDIQADPEKLNLETKIKYTEQSAGKLEQRDPDCQSETCVFIVDAVRAQKDLPGLKEQLKNYTDAMENRIAACDTEIEQIGKERAPLAAKALDLSNQINEFETGISNVKGEMQSNETLLHEKLNDIQKLKLKSDQLQAKLDQAPDLSKLRMETDALKARLDELNTDFNDKTTEACSWLEEQRTEAYRLRQQATGLLVDDEAERHLTDAEISIKATQSTIERLKNEISDIQSRLAVLEHQQKEAATLESEIAEEKARVDAMKKEIADWRYLQNACGKDGLRALEIDGTAPLISNYANDLLTETFGPGQTIGFRTQNEDGKEVLDIVVYREGDDAEGTLVDKLSGGERVWSLKALRLALTLVSKMKSGRNFQTAFSDEEDGALDAENAQSFINLYRAFMTAGGFESIIYITHRDECKALADHVIKLSDKGIEIESKGFMNKAA